MLRGTQGKHCRRLKRQIVISSCALIDHQNIDAITRLNSAIEISNQQNLTILSLSHDIAAMMSHLDPFIKLDVECATRHLQNPETTPDDLLLGLPHAAPEWFSENAGFMGEE